MHAMPKRTTLGSPPPGRSQVDHREARPCERPGDSRRSPCSLNDSEILDVVANVALTTFTNYLNEAARTEIDFPVVTHQAR